MLLSENVKMYTSSSNALSNNSGHLPNTEIPRTAADCAKIDFCTDASPSEGALRCGRHSVERVTRMQQNAR